MVAYTQIVHRRSGGALDDMQLLTLMPNLVEYSYDSNLFFPGEDDHNVRLNHLSTLKLFSPRVKQAASLRIPNLINAEFAKMYRDEDPLVGINSLVICSQCSLRRPTLNDEVTFGSELLQLFASLPGLEPLHITYSPATEELEIPETADSRKFLSEQNVGLRTLLQRLTHSTEQRILLPQLTFIILDVDDHVLDCPLVADFGRRSWRLVWKEATTEYPYGIAKLAYAKFFDCDGYKTYDAAVDEGWSDSVSESGSGIDGEGDTEDDLYEYKT